MRKQAILCGLAIAFVIGIGADNPDKEVSPPAREQVSPDKDAKKTKTEWVNELVRKLKGSSDVWVRVAAVKELGKTADPKAVPSLRQALTDESVDVNVEALRSLKKIGDDESLNLLLRGAVLYDLQSLRFYAVDAAASINPDKTKRYLKNNLKSEFPQTRANAAEGLGNFCVITKQADKETVQIIVSTLGQKNGEHQGRVNDALNAITGANIDDADKDKWEDWLKKNKDKIGEPPKKVLSESKPVKEDDNKAKAEEKKQAEAKYEEFRDKAIINKQPGDNSASYYTGRNEEGKRLSIAAFGNNDERVLKIVDEALNWLHRHQEKEGFWDYQGYIRNCPHGKPDNAALIKGHYNVAVTGLALLAFMGAGHTHIPGQKIGLPAGGEYPSVVSDKGALQPRIPGSNSLPLKLPEYKPTVERGLRWLLSIQRPDGSFDNPTSISEPVNMFEQAMATLAVSEAYGMTGDPSLKEPAQKAMDFISFAKNPGKGWRYKPRCGDNDTSLVGWQVFALKSGKVAGLNIKREDLADASDWIDEMTDTGSGRVGYNKKGQGSVTITSIGIICRMLLGWRSDSSMLQQGAKYVVADKAYQKDESNFYHIYQTALAMFQMGGEYWEDWNSQMTGYLGRTICKEGCEKGSWDASKDKYSKSRVYTTALGALSLEVYYRYLPFAR